MKWWYENEEDMPRKITLVDYDKEGKPFHRDVVVPKTAEEARRLEMEFDKSRVYTALNADELKQGDKVIVANTMANLREDVRKGINIDMLREVHGEDCLSRFIVKEGWFPLAYLVERKENCTNCGAIYTCAFQVREHPELEKCKNWKPKKKCDNCGQNCEGWGNNIPCSQWKAKDERECTDCKHIDWASDEVCLKKHRIGKGEANYCSEFERAEPKTEQKAEQKNCYNCRLTYTRDGVMRCMMNDQRCNNPEVACNHYEPKTGKKEMCLNCKHYNKVNDFRDCTLVNNPTGACPHYEAEKHYRPFKDTDELIKVWCEHKRPAHNHRERGLTMPLIWVRNKSNSKNKGFLISGYDTYSIHLDFGEVIPMLEFFNEYTFLDGSPCGVEE